MSKNSTQSRWTNRSEQPVRVRRLIGYLLSGLVLAAAVTVLASIVLR